LTLYIQALADPYFKNIANVDREPSAQPVTKLEFEFERRRITKEDIRELIYREILEYHPNLLREFLEGTESTGFMYPRCVVMPSFFFLIASEYLTEVPASGVCQCVCML
jgi:hypothetical protein